MLWLIKVRRCRVVQGGLATAEAAEAEAEAREEAIEGIQVEKGIESGWSVRNGEGKENL